MIENGYNLTGVEDAVDEALPLILSVDVELDTAAREAKDDYESKSSELEAAKEKVKRLETEKSSIRGTTSQRGRQGRRTAQTLSDTDLDRLVDVVARIAAAKGRVKSLTKARKDALELEKEKAKEYEDWKKEFPYRTTEQLLEYGKVLLHSATEYYNKVFLWTSGDSYQTRRMAEAAQLFNPVWLAETIKDEADIINILYPLADMLKSFGYKRITDNLIKQLKKEMNDVVEEARNYSHDLDNIKSSKPYQTRMQKRIVRAKLPEGTVLDWKDDSGEYATRIWKWWKGRRHKFKVHALVLRLIVLTQLSSCNVERVFSQLELIRQRCGEKMLDDLAELRIFLQCNGNLDDLYHEMKKYEDKN